MKVKECEIPTCHELINIKSHYCEKHRQLKQEEYQAKQQHRFELYNKHNRNKEANNFYHSSQWEHTRNYIINRDCYICQVCGETITDRKIIDHIIPRRIDKDRQLDTNNLWTLCYRCHAIKTKLEEQIINSSNGINKIKHISRDTWIRYIKERC